MTATHPLDPLRSAPKPGSCVLVVEDDIDTREALEELLESAGYEVLAAPNGVVALTLLQSQRDSGHACSAVILDLMMPVMNGWDFRARQRADPALSTIPVLLMSAGGHLDAVSDELQAADHISKPVDARDLLDKVARLVT